MWSPRLGLELREADARRQAATTPGIASLLQDAADARRRGVAALEGVEDEIDRATQSVDAWIAEFDHTQGERTAGERMADGWSAFKSAVGRVWNFELFSVEDSVVVDGQHVTVARGVTVGKSIGAVLIFLGGLWAVGSLLRVLERRLVARGFNAPWVRTFKRWVMVLAALVLLLLTLNAARIPLTVFAFLGGALAIGVGFGTQTIIRNFISGMIVLAERRVRIGDTIEVDGITGTVASVDFRSTTVKGFDGVETIVPNSVLLENKVTNWTFTDQKVRRSVKIGVAYGSNLREVAELLEETVKRHGNVLAEPPPQVYLEDFGDNAISFTIHFWVDLSKVASSHAGDERPALHDRQAPGRGGCRHRLPAARRSPRRAAAAQGRDRSRRRRFRCGTGLKGFRRPRDSLPQAVARAHGPRLEHERRERRDERHRAEDQRHARVGLSERHALGRERRERAHPFDRAGDEARLQRACRPGPAHEQQGERGHRERCEPSAPAR